VVRYRFGLVPGLQGLAIEPSGAPRLGDPAELAAAADEPLSSQAVRIIAVFGVGLGEAHHDPRIWLQAATSARFFSGGVGACIAALSRRCRIGDRVREGFGETIIAPVVHMQPVW
jgi:hypothetical protein